MDQSEAIWQVLLWGLGICATGFFTLLGLFFKSSRDMSKPLQEIRDALVGTLDKPGLIPKFHNMEHEISSIKEKCIVHHGKG